MTQFLMTGKSTKAMNFSNMKAATRTYKVAQCNASRTAVVVEAKVRGRVIGNVVCHNDNGSFQHIATAHFKNMTPLDIAECISVAKRILKIS